MINYNDFPQFFLGCNSGGGFVSYFGQAYDIKNGWFAYIIKGGPGTGKSTFMKKIAKRAADKGLKVILSPCTGDPDSLDAVILPQKRVIIMDGTAPHVVEGKYIGASERIINIGDSFNFAALREKREEIIKTSDMISTLYRRVYRYTAVTAALKKDTAKLALPALLPEKIDAFCSSFAKKHLKTKPSGSGREMLAFLDGLTCKGNVFFKDTAGMFADNITAICDKNCVVSSLVVQKIRDEALRRGYDVITCPDPLLPDKVLRHIIIPEAGVALTTAEVEVPTGAAVKKIHAKRFLNADKLAEHRERIAFNRRAESEINESVFATMKGCKQLHDQLEDCYRDAVDFSGVDALFEEIIADIDSLPTYK